MCVAGRSLRIGWEAMKLEDLARLYPTLTPDELEEAGENLRQYLLLAWEIWEREQASLTPDATDRTIKAKVDSLKQNLPPNS